MKTFFTLLIAFTFNAYSEDFSSTLDQALVTPEVSFNVNSLAEAITCAEADKDEDYWLCHRDTRPSQIYKYEHHIPVLFQALELTQDLDRSILNTEQTTRVQLALDQICIKRDEINQSVYPLVQLTECL